MWKKEIFGPLVNAFNKREDIRGNSVMYNFVSITHDEFEFFYNLFYEDNKKNIKKDMAQYLTPFALAIWVMDDGSKCQAKNTMRIATDCFSKDENELLASFIKLNFNISAKVSKYTRHDKKYYYLSFNVKNASLLSEVIRPYVVKSMNYKLCSNKKNIPV